MPETVQQWVHALAENDGPGLLFEDQSWTWRETVGDAAARARVLADWAEPGRPLHVGVLLENTPEMVRALLAGAIGAHVTVGVNATRRGEALAADVRRADCQVLLTDAEHLPLLAGLDLGGARVVDTDGPEWAELTAAADRSIGALPGDLPEVGTMDTFMLIFTSGTSGEPKAVQVANFMVVMSGSVLAEKYELGGDDVCYCAMPLFHSNAIMASLGPALHAGAAIALVRKFSASSFLGDVRRFGATYMNYVGKPLAYILATPEQPDDAENPLRVAFGNEASDRDIEQFGRRFGCTVWDGFGSTETAIIITRTEDTPLGSIGVPFDGVAVYDRETRTECPRATFDEHGRVTNLDACVGELVNTQGAGFFAGYYKDEKATADRLDGGMYWSGDLGYRDEAGFVYLAGRTDDWLRVDGENLAAAPVEALLLRHPAISQAAVYAVPDENVGDQLMVTLVLRDDARLDPAGFEEFLAAQPDLSPKAWPRFVRIADEVPTTATNKILKRTLRSEGTGVADPVWERAERGRSYALRAGADA
ncbi:fatty-acid--CoA ligase FadD1 [Marmoricola sp. RAF53]|uniref:fatty-acid--CoA ligase FadD1 n=1 Tax=Marmoricola sp. RAF53 TaxID=3233059 RepID=UPI003F9B5A71